MSEPIAVRIFHFEVNAIFAKDALSKLGIETTIKESDQHFELMASPTDSAKASAEIDKLNLDESPLHKDSEGYLKDVDEWMKHMYNPVYWLERIKLPHFFYKNATKRILGILILLPALGAYIGEISNHNGTLSNGTIILFEILCGMILIWQSFSKKK